MPFQRADFHSIRVWLREVLGSDQPIAAADREWTQGNQYRALLGYAATTVHSEFKISALNRTASIALLELGDLHWGDCKWGEAEKYYGAHCLVVPSTPDFVRARLASSACRAHGTVEGWHQRLRELEDHTLAPGDEAMLTRDVRDLLTQAPQRMEPSLAALLADPETRDTGFRVLHKAGTPQALAVLFENLAQVLPLVAGWDEKTMRELLRAPASLGRWAQMQSSLRELTAPLAAARGDAPSGGWQFLERLAQPRAADRLSAPVAPQGLFNGPEPLQRLRRWEQAVQSGGNRPWIATQRHPFSLWLHAAAGAIPWSSAAPGWPFSNVTTFLVRRLDLDGKELWDCYDGAQSELHFTWSAEGNRYSIPGSDSPLSHVSSHEADVRVGITMALLPSLPTAEECAARKRKAGAAVRIPDVGDHLMNELTFLDKAVEVGIADAVGVLYVVADPIVALENLFPEFADRIVRMPEAEVFERAAADGVSLLPASDFFVTPSLAQRLKAACRAASKPALLEQCEQLRATCPKLVLLTVRGDGVSLAVNWVQAMREVLAGLREREPGLGCIVFGFSLPRDAPAEAGQAAVQKERQMVARLFRGPLADMPHINLSGERLADAMYAASLCDAYVSHLGTLQHLAGWLGGKRGVVHGSSVPDNRHPMFRCVPPQQHPVVVAGELVEGSVPAGGPAEFRRDLGQYRLDGAAILEAVRPLL